MWAISRVTVLQCLKRVKTFILIELNRAKTNIMAFALIDYSGHPWHMYTLVKVIAVHIVHS